MSDHMVEAFIVGWSLISSPSTFSLSDERERERERREGE